MNEKKIPTNPNFKMTTAEAITLIRIMKQRVEKTILEFPEPGMKLEFNVFAQKIGILNGNPEQDKIFLF